MNVPKYRPIATVLFIVLLFLGLSRPVEAAGFGSVHPPMWMSSIMAAVEEFVGHLFAPHHAAPAPMHSPHHASPTISRVTLPIPAREAVHTPPPHTADPAPTKTLIFNPFANLLLISKYGDLYPAERLAPALGATTHPYSQLNMTKASIDSNGSLWLSGALTVSGFGTGVVHTDSQGHFSTAAIDLGTGDIKGVLPVGSGGIGATSLTTNGVLYGNGTAGIAALTPGTSGYVLQSNGTSGSPSWVAATGLSAGSVFFSGVTSGTNTTASLLVGSGASLDVTGAGTINVSSLLGGTWASPGVIGGTTANTATFSTLTANGNATIGGSTGMSVTGSGAGISFGGAGNHAISAAAGTLQLGAVTLTGALTGNAQTITGLGTVALAAGSSYQINGVGVLSATTLGGGVVNSSLTSLGTIITGTWNGTPVGAAYGGTGATTLASNGVLYGNGTGPVQVTAAGTTGQLLLGVTAGAPAFATLSGDATITNGGILSLKNSGPGAGSLGTTAAQTPVVTVDAQGRVTAVSNTAIALDAAAITSGTLGIARGGTNSRAYTTGSLVYYDGGKLAEDNANLFWDSANHRLGLGTTAPLAALDVAGSASLSGGLAYRGAGSAHTISLLDGGTYSIQRSPGGSSLVSSLFIDASGNVGIGTTSPTALFSVGAASQFQVNTAGRIDAKYLSIGDTPAADGASKPLLQLTDTTTAYNASPTVGILFGGVYTSGGASVNLSGINGLKENAISGNYASALSFLTRGNGGSITERMRIDSGGNVGIGTTAPVAKMQVTGTSGIGYLSITNTDRTYAVGGRQYHGRAR